MSLFEWFAVAVTLAAVYLAVRQRVWCWPLGIVSATMYAWIFYEARLYADAGLQGLYLVLAAYGWWAWLRGGSNRGALEVSTVSIRGRLILFAIGALAGVFLGRALSLFTDASLPFMDSMLTSFSIVGQWLQARKKLEAWLIWLAVDVFYVGMFIYKGLYPTAGLYAVFLYLAVLGFIEWRRRLPPPSI